MLPEAFAMEVIMRMLRMESVQKDVLDDVERVLRNEFMSNLARTSRRDAHEMIADIFNNLDRASEQRFLTALEERNRDSAEKVRSLMFTFEDLGKLDPGGVQTLLRNIEKDKLPTALKGASEVLRDLFLSNMSERASKMLKEDMAAMGPVRVRDVEEAQLAMRTNSPADLAYSFCIGEIPLEQDCGDHKHSDEHQERNGGGGGDIEVHETFALDEQRDEVGGARGSALGQHIDCVECRDGEHQAEHNRDDDDPPHHGQRDEQQDLPAVGAVDLG